MVVHSEFSHERLRTRTSGEPVEFRSVAKPENSVEFTDVALFKVKDFTWWISIETGMIGISTISIYQP